MDDPMNRREVEVKYRLTEASDHERLRHRLAAMGAQPSPVQHEENVLFDSRSGDLRRRLSLLRVRSIDGGSSGTLTFKGPPSSASGVKTREEIEVAIEDAASMQALLEALGFEPGTSYSKQRESWYLDDLEVSLDTASIGYFCEIEGPQSKILALGRRLELSDDQVEAAGYAELFASAKGRPGYGPPSPELVGAVEHASRPGHVQTAAARAVTTV